MILMHVATYFASFCSYLVGSNRQEIKQKQILSIYQNYIMLKPTFEQNKTTNSKKHISKNTLLYIIVDFVDIFQFLVYRLI
jgi:hypothetical protein